MAKGSAYQEERKAETHDGKRHKEQSFECQELTGMTRLQTGGFFSYLSEFNLQEVWDLESPVRQEHPIKPLFPEVEGSPQ